MKKNIYIFTRCIWTFINFRYDLVNKIDRKKYNVSVCMDFDGYTKKNLEQKFKKIRFININFLNNNNSFLFNLKIIKDVFQVFWKNKINIANNFTARPIVFVTLISFFFLKTKVINTITGLGNNFFQKKNIFRIIYNLLFLKSKYVIFQNHQDKKIIYKFLFNKINTKIIYPSVKFKKKFNKSKAQNNKTIFLMHSRMIKQKGVIEYIDAIKKLSKFYKKKSLFYLIGSPDKNNPSSIPQMFLNSLSKNKILKYLKHTKNIHNYILNSDVIVLPSYGEGLPASLLEALFFKKAIITTRVNGCVELVQNNYNGYLVQPRNSHELYLSILKLLKKPNLIYKFKENSYRLFKKKFNRNTIKQYLDIYNSI